MGWWVEGSVKFGVVSGNLETGPSVYAVSIAPGFAFDSHMHSSDYWAIVCQGEHYHGYTGDNTEESKEIRYMQEGETWSRTGGVDTWHQDGNPSGDEWSFLLVAQEGPNDTIQDWRNCDELQVIKNETGRPEEDMSVWYEMNCTGSPKKDRLQKKVDRNRDRRDSTQKGRDRLHAKLDRIQEKLDRK